MPTQTIDARGLKCPQPILKITASAIKMKAGDIIEIIADCSTFENDLRDWCQRSKKMLMWVKEEAGAKKAQIQF
ncbi:MAG: sulfurtransferase TusA family protein [Deltaproteobacteria bacterium]|nr:sulfurtransferase TusA family protein [Deltaproteobacteria bacterium]